MLNGSSVNRNDLARAVYDVHGGLSQAESQRIVDQIFGTIRDHLLRGEKVLLSGFGCFRVKTRKERRGVNPQTGESIVVPGRKAIIFKPSRYLKSV
jgi:nucleoid DNA-binding protein